MRKFILFSIFIIASMGYTQDEHVTDLGRWGKGPCQAVHRWNGYTLVGNGSYLELYKKIGFNFTLRDRLALDGPVEAIIAETDLSGGIHANVYVACGYEGLKCIYLDPDPFGEDLIQIGELDVDGYANDIDAYTDGTGNIDAVYVSTGDSSVHIVNVAFPSAPALSGTQNLPYSVNCVTAFNDSILLAGVGEKGLYSINASDASSPDTLQHLTFPGFLLIKPFVHGIATNDSVAFVATGLGGLKSVDLRNLQNIQIYPTVWNAGNASIVDVFVENDYVHVSAGDDGVYSYIDISDPSNLGFERSTYNTGGFASDIVFESDTLYIADEFNGHVIVDINRELVADSISTADKSYDVIFEDNAAFIASGKHGITKLDINDISVLEEDMLSELQYINTDGEARSIYSRDPYLFVATGSHGLQLWEITNPSAAGKYNAPGDSTFDVIVPPGSNCYLAAGKSGIEVINYSNPLDPFRVRQVNTPGKALALDYQDDEIFVADSQAVYVYQMDGSNLILVDSLTHNNTPMHAFAVKARGDSVLFANGQYGFGVWNRETDEFDIEPTNGKCTDLALKENTLYLTLSGNGLAIYDISDTEESRLMGTWKTGAHAAALALSDDFVGLADKEDGFYLYQNRIKPKMDRTGLSGFNFGPVPPGYSRSTKMTIRNIGTAQLNVTDIHVVSNSAFFNIHPSSFYVPPQDSQIVTVEFIANSTSFRDISTTLEIFSNDPDSAVVSRTLKGKVSQQMIEEPYLNDIFTLGLYEFDEVSGNAFLDASDYEHEGYITPAVDRSSETVHPSGTSLYFSGSTDDKAIIPYASHHNMDGEEFTIEFWFNMASKPSDYYIMMQRGVGSSYQYQMSLGADTEQWKGIVAEVIDQQGEIYRIETGSMEDLFIDHWYHTALTLKNDTLSLLLNGNAMDEVVIHDHLMSINSDSVIIGTNSLGSLPYHGYFDELRFSSVARQSWEFNVNRTGIALQDDLIDFGAVQLYQSRLFPIKMINSGNNDLIISEIAFSEPVNGIQFDFTDAFTLDVDEDTTIFIQWAPEALDSLEGDAKLIIHSNDPTFPQKRIPIHGYTITTLDPGEYRSDYFTLGLWHCNETSGFDLSDASRFNMPGRLQKGSVFDTEKKQFEAGASIRFDGINDLCKLKAITPAHLGSVWGGFTAECWFRLENSLPEKRGRLLYSESVSSNIFDLSVEGTTLKGRIFNTAGDSFVVVTEDDFVDTQHWYHAAISLSDDSLHLYLNGEVQDAKPFSGYLAGTQNGSPQDTFTVIVGNDIETLSPFYGNIDEIRLSGINRQRWEFNVNLARISISENDLNFGNMLINQSRELSLNVKNPGIATLIVDSLYLSSGTYFDISINEFNLDPNFSQEILISFQPDEAGIYKDTLNIICNDPYWSNKILEIPVSGTGVLSKVSGQYVPDPFTLALYHCNKGSGNVLSDTTSNNIDAVIIGENAWTDTTQYGNSALNLEKAVVYSETNPLAFATNNQFSVEFWFFVNEAPSQKSVFYFSGDTDTLNFTEIYWNPGSQINAKVRNNNGTLFELHQTESDTVYMQWWNHVALTLDDAYLRLYLNKTCIDSMAWSGEYQGDGIMMLGADSARVNPVNCLMDEIRISGIGRQRWELNVSPPTILTYPNSLLYTRTLVGYKGQRTVLVQNTGDQRLNVHANFKYGEVFEAPVSDFILPEEGGANEKVLKIHFVPDDAGVYIDTLILSSNDINNPEIRIPVSGEAVTHILSGEPTIDTLTVSYYNFNTDVGNAIGDLSGNGYIAYLRNGALWTNQGAYSGGLFLDGINDYIEVQTPSESSVDFTLECFFKTDTNSQIILSKTFQDTTLKELQICIDSYGRIVTKNINATKIGPYVVDNAWHHLALTYRSADDSTLFYVDGNHIWGDQWQLNNGWYDSDPIVLGASLSDQSGNTFSGYIDEFQISKFPREIWNYIWLSQNYGVYVSRMNPTTPEFGELLNLHVNVPVALNADSVQVMYRSGGEIQYKNSLGTVFSDTIYSVDVPAEDISLQGFEYYFRVTNDTGYTFTIPSLDAANKPYTQVIHSENLDVPVEYHLQYFQDKTVRYQYISLFSVPFELDNARAVTLIEKSFGEYDPYQWRLFWWNTTYGVYREYSFEYDQTAPEIFRLDPGRAFWLIRHNDKSFTLDGFSTVDTDQGYSIDLAGSTRNIVNLNTSDPDTIQVLPGWNMVANPFNFPVDWESCIVTSDSVSTLYGFNGKDGFTPNVKVLEPWKGYFIVNMDTNKAEIIVPPKKSQTTLSKTNADPLGLAKNDWALQLRLTSAYSNDTYNYIGVKESASNTWDVEDLPEPPYLADYSNLSINNSHWKSHPGSYTTDYRKYGNDGYIWKVEIGSTFKNTDISIDWEFFSELPDDWDAYLLDTQNNVAHSLLNTKSLKLKTNNEQYFNSQYICVIGSHEFIENHRGDISLSPPEFKLFQNYPNPFNLTTEIKYSIPSDTNVKLLVYNALGQEVVTLVEKQQNAGYYTVNWKGLNKQGLEVASGVYIIRLKTDIKSSTAKMLLLK